MRLLRIGFPLMVVTMIAGTAAHLLLYVVLQWDN